MLRRVILAVWALAALGTAAPASALSLAVKAALGPPGWVLPHQPDLQFAFARGAAWKGSGTGGGAVVPVESLLTVTRASAATDLLPTSPGGFPYASFAANQLVRSPNLGALIFEARTGLLLNSTVPATQTTGSLANGTYTLWVNGSGSATMSAGTATGCGTGVATNGTPVNFTTTGAAGTCTVTVAGSLNAFQLELGTFGTPLIITAGVTATRAADFVTSPVPLGSAYSMLASGTPNAILTSAVNQTLTDINDAGTSNRLFSARLATTGVPFLGVTSGGTLSTITMTTAWTQFVKGKIASSTIAGTQAGTFNGETIVNRTSANPVNPIRVGLGSTALASSVWNGQLDLVTVWGRTLLPAIVLKQLAMP